jgi:hypothetical protein
MQEIHWMVVLPCCSIPLGGLLIGWLVYRSGWRASHTAPPVRSRWDGVAQDQGLGGDHGKGSNLDR